MAQERVPDIVLLDWMIENLSGIEVCRRLRRNSNTANVPIIMLTARGEEEDRVRGLETGADDYVTKPFSPRELVARVGAVLRRVRPGLAGETLNFGDIEMDTVGHKVRRDGQMIPLGPTEYRLLRISWNIPAGFSRASAFWTASGAMTATSSCARSTCTSAACARRSTWAASATSSAPCARQAMRWIPKRPENRS
jgi:response regulator of citrate/malate metabolism